MQAVELALLLLRVGDARLEGANLLGEAPHQGGVPRRACPACLQLFLEGLLGADAGRHLAEPQRRDHQGQRPDHTGQHAEEGE